MPAEKASPLRSKIKIFGDSATEPGLPLNGTGESAGSSKGDPLKSKVKLFGEKKDVTKPELGNEKKSQTGPMNGVSDLPIDKKEPTRGESTGDDVVSTLPVNKKYKPSGVEFDITEEAMGSQNEEVKLEQERKKTQPRISKKDDKLEVPVFETPSDATGTYIGDKEGNVSVRGTDGTETKVPTGMTGKDLVETAADFGNEFGNSFNQWLNDQWQNVVNPNKQGVPMNPFMDIPFSSYVTKLIPGYESPRYKSMENLPESLKELKLPTNSKYGVNEPEAPVKFMGHLTAGLVPLIMGSALGLPPTMTFPLINEAGLQQMLKKGEITESEAMYERGAATLMGGLFEMPVARTLFKEIQSLPVKESTKLGLTKGGDVFYKTVGTGMIDALKQIAQGKKPDMDEVFTNAGTIFVMELFGGHQKLKKMGEKFGNDRLIEFAKRMVRGEKVDPEIQSDVEAVHNKPITDVKRLLIGAREHRFEVGETGEVRDLTLEKPQEMLLTTLEKVYGMKPEEIRAARDNMGRMPRVENTEYPPGGPLPEGRRLPPRQESKFEIDTKGEIKPIERKSSEDMLLSTKGMKPEEIEASRKKIDEKMGRLKDEKIEAVSRKGAETQTPGQKLQDWQIEQNKKPQLHTEKEIADKLGEVIKAVEDNPEIGVTELGKKIGVNVTDKDTMSMLGSLKSRIKKGTLREFINDANIPFRIEDNTGDKSTGKPKTSGLEKPPVESSKGELDSRLRGNDSGELIAGDKVRSRNYRNPEEVLEVVDPRTDNMVKVRDSKGHESLVSKNGLESVERQTGMSDLPGRVEELAGKIRKSRGKAREDLVRQFNEHLARFGMGEFNPEKGSQTAKVIEYLDAKAKIKSSKGKFGLQSSLLPGGFNPENFPEYVKIGKYHLETLKSAAKDKAVSFGTWGIRMVEEFGEYIRPHLGRLWREVQKAGEPGLRDKSGLKEEKPEAKSSQTGMSDLPEGFRPERVNQQSDFGFGDAGKVKESRVREELKGKETMKRYEAFNIVELKDEYYKLKNERNKWESDSKEYRKLTLEMNDIKARIEGIQTVSTKGRMTTDEAAPKNKEELFKRIVQKLPEYESKVNTEGLTGEDAIEGVRKLIRRELQTADTYQKLESGQKYALMKMLDEKFRVLNKERLQISAGMEEPYAEKRLRKWIKRGINQSLTQVEKWGEGGKDFARRMRKMQDRERELMGDPSVIAIESGQLTKAEYENLKAIRNAMMMETGRVPQPISENVRKFNDRIDRYYSKTAELLRRRGFETLNAMTGEVYEFTPRKDYDPRILQIEADKLGIQRDKNGEAIFNKKRERQLEYMVEGGQARSKSEAADMLDQYIQQEKVNIGKMGNVEYARVKDIEFAPEMYMQDPMRRFVDYATKVSRRIAHEENFGMDGGIAYRLLDRIKSEKYDESFARDLYRYETGNLTPREREAMSDVNFVKGFQAVTKFSPFTTLRNSLQGVLGSSIRGNLKASMQGLLKSFTKEARSNALQSGALADTIESIIMKEVGGEGKTKFSDFVSNYLKWIGFTGTDRFNRVVGATAGEVFYKDMLSRIKNDSMLKKRAMREFEKMGLNAEEIVKRGKFTEDELNLIRRTFAGDTQFNIRPADLPLWWSSPMGKLVTQWKPFSYKMTQLIRDNVISEIKKGNPMPLITMVAAYGVGGEAVNTIIDLVRGFLNFNPRKDEKEKGLFTRGAYMRIKEGDVEGLVYRLVEDYAGLGALGFMADIFRSMGYGKAGDTLSGVTSAVLGPTTSTFLSATADITGPVMQKLWSSEGEWDEAGLRSLRGLYRQVLTNVPVGSIPRTFGFTRWLEKQIFPEKINETQKLYEELEGRGIDTGKLEELENQRKEVRKLYDKAKETKSREDIDAYVKADEELEKRQDESPEYQKLSDLRWERNQDTAELFGKGKYKIWNELKGKGIDVGKLKEIDVKERELRDLKEKAERTKDRNDVKAFRDAEYRIKKLKTGREYREFEKLKKAENERKKREREF